MAYVYAWTTAAPVSTDLVKDGAAEIRDGVKAALNERIQSVIANIDNDPWQFKNIAAATTNLYDIGTTAARFKAGYINALAINIAVTPDAGSILLANSTGALMARNNLGSANLTMMHMSTGDVLQLYNGAATLTTAGVLAATTFSGALSGNATTATTLQTARLIWGQSFNGSAAISGAMTYGGVTLANAVTGTGNMVLSAGPTFTGTAAFAAVTATSQVNTANAAFAYQAIRTDAAGNIGHYRLARNATAIGYIGQDASDNLVIAGGTGSNSITVNKTTDAVTFLAGISATTGAFSTSWTVSAGGYDTTLTQDGTGVKLRHNSAIRNIIIGSNSGTAITVNADNTVTFAQAATFAAISATTITGSSHVEAGAAALLGWTGRTQFQSPSDGVLEITNNGGTDFTRIQLGGTTASFPALKRSTTELQVVLADDSAFTTFRIGRLVLDGAVANISWNSTAPGAPANGEMWFDGANMKMRAAGTTRTFTWV